MLQTRVWIFGGDITPYSTTSTHGSFVPCPVSLALRDQDPHLRSHEKIGDCEQSKSLSASDESTQFGCIGHGWTCCEFKIELVRMPRRNIVARTWPNDHNMQQPQMLHEKFDHFQIWANSTQHVATFRNTSQQGGQTHATCCTIQCCDRLARA